MNWFKQILIVFCGLCPTLAWAALDPSREINVLQGQVQIMGQGRLLLSPGERVNTFNVRIPTNLQTAPDSVEIQLLQKGFPIADFTKLPNQFEHEDQQIAFDLDLSQVNRDGSMLLRIKALYPNTLLQVEKPVALYPDLEVIAIDQSVVEYQTQIQNLRGMIFANSTLNRKKTVIPRFRVYDPDNTQVIPLWWGQAQAVDNKTFYRFPFHVRSELEPGNYELEVQFLSGDRRQILSRAQRVGFEVDAKPPVEISLELDTDAANRSVVAHMTVSESQKFPLDIGFYRADEQWFKTRWTPSDSELQKTLNAQLPEGFKYPNQTTIKVTQLGQMVWEQTTNLSWDLAPEPVKATEETESEPTQPTPPATNGMWTRALGLGMLITALGMIGLWAKRRFLGLMLGLCLPLGCMAANIYSIGFPASGTFYAYDSGNEFHEIYFFLRGVDDATGNGVFSDPIAQIDLQFTDTSNGSNTFTQTVNLVNSTVDNDEYLRFHTPHSLPEGDYYVVIEVYTDPGSPAPYDLHQIPVPDLLGSISPGGIIRVDGTAPGLTHSFVDGVAPTKEPITVEVTCTDSGAGCLWGEGNGGVDTFEVRGNFCSDPLICDTASTRTVSLCDAINNCADLEVVTNWYDPVKPDFLDFTQDATNFTGMALETIENSLNFAFEGLTGLANNTLSAKDSYDLDFQIEDPSTVYKIPYNTITSPGTDTDGDGHPDEAETYFSTDPNDDTDAPSILYTDEICDSPFCDLADFEDGGGSWERIERPCRTPDNQPGTSISGGACNPSCGDGFALGNPLPPFNQDPNLCYPVCENTAFDAFTDSMCFDFEVQ